MKHALRPSPLGEILLTFDDDALLGLYFVGQKDQPTIAPHWRVDDAHPIAAMTSDRIERYFLGVEEPFEVPIAFAGTRFQVAVWRALLDIPRGETISYAELARRVGSPAAVRAVGAAVGRNPVSIFVPCHRVVGSNGALTGYAGGLPRKTHLLRLERALGDDGRARRAGGQSALPLGAAA
jgi:methylated-DNA-[protein]-cysteine S-methyltransferase